MHGVLWVLRIGRVGFAWVLVVLMGVRRWRVIVWLVDRWLGLKLQMPPKHDRALLCILMPTRLPCWCLIYVLHLILINVLIVDLIHYVSPRRLVNRG